ncbi:hypothetical protein, partial [Nocardioides malaquae]|uniref:hypothetical protein n=1 Tax=Nocardioides malaquae TaxID=2773426 RepID=UPI001D0CFF00
GGMPLVHLGALLRLERNIDEDRRQKDGEKRHKDNSKYRAKENTIAEAHHLHILFYISHI